MCSSLNANMSFVEATNVTFQLVEDQGRMLIWLTNNGIGYRLDINTTARNIGVDSVANNQVSNIGQISFD